MARFKFPFILDLSHKIQKHISDFTTKLALCNPNTGASDSIELHILQHQFVIQLNAKPKPAEKRVLARFKSCIRICHYCAKPLQSLLS